MKVEQRLAPIADQVHLEAPSVGRRRTIDLNAIEFGCFDTGRVWDSLKFSFISHKYIKKSFDDLFLMMWMQIRCTAKPVPTIKSPEKMGEGEKSTLIATEIISNYF